MTKWSLIWVTDYNFVFTREECHGEKWTVDLNLIVDYRWKQIKVPLNVNNDAETQKTTHTRDDEVQVHLLVRHVHAKASYQCTIIFVHERSHNNVTVSRVYFTITQKQDVISFCSPVFSGRCWMVQQFWLGVLIFAYGSGKTLFRIHEHLEPHQAFFKYVFAKVQWQLFSCVGALLNMVNYSSMSLYDALAQSPAFWHFFSQILGSIAYLTRILVYETKEVVKCQNSCARPNFWRDALQFKHRCRDKTLGATAFRPKNMFMPLQYVYKNVYNATSLIDKEVLLMQFLPHYFRKKIKLTK